MKMSSNGIELLRFFEGDIDHVYADPIGLLTSGVGHLIPIGTEYHHEGIEIPADVRARWLREDIEKAERIVHSLGIVLKQHEHDSLTSLAFNIPRAFAPGTGLRSALDRGSLAEVPAQIRRWNRAGGKVLEGLRRRRAAEARLFETGEWREWPTLRKGDRGPAVARLQEMLVAVGYPSLVVDGQFGYKTEAAVENFQAGHPALRVDRVVGPEVWKALDAALAAEGEGAC